MNLRGPHGLEIRFMRFPFREEAGYIIARRALMRVALGQKWLLHPANAPMRVKPLDEVIEFPTPQGMGRFRESN